MMFRKELGIGVVIRKLCFVGFFSVMTALFYDFYIEKRIYYRLFGAKVVV
jgi:hypothetical protein